MRKVLISLTPLVFSLAACSQTPKSTAAAATPAPTPAAATPSSSAATPAIAAQPAAPLHPITDAQVQELMAITGTDKLKEQLTEYILRNIHQAPFMPQDVIDDMTTSLAKVDVNTGAVATYKKYLSTEDATTIIAFYKTPAGHDLIAATPHLMADVQRSAMQSGQQVAKEVIERHRPEIEAAQKAYQAQHSAPGQGVGPTLGPTPAAPSAPATSAKPATPPTTPPSK